MAFCSNCNTLLQGEQRFCSICGTPKNDAVASDARRSAKSFEDLPAETRPRPQTAVDQPTDVPSIAEQAAQYGKPTQLIIGVIEKVDNFLKEKIFIDKKRTAIILGSYAGALFITSIIPPLRGIRGHLFSFLWMAVILYIPVLMLRLYAATPGRIKDAANMYPQLYNFFGVLDTPIAPLLLDDVVVRFVWRTLPKELRDSEPIIDVAHDFALRCEPGVAGFVGKKAKRLWGCTAMEYGMMYKTVLDAVEVMSSRFGLTGGRTYRPLIKYIGHPTKVVQRGTKSLWQANLGEAKPSDQQFAVLLEKHLKSICSAMGLDYDDQTLGEYDPGKSTWLGWGSWGAIGIGAGLSIASAMKRSAKKTQFRTACAYAAFNNIAAQFNAQYFPAEFEAWMAEQTMDRVRLDGSHTM